MSRSLRTIDWRVVPVAAKRVAWTVTGSQAARHEDEVRFTLEFWPKATLTMTVAEAVFVVGDVHDLSPEPPDYVTGVDVVVDQALPHWTSSFTPIGATARDAAGPSR